MWGLSAKPICRPGIGPSLTASSYCCQFPKWIPLFLNFKRKEKYGFLVLCKKTSLKHSLNSESVREDMIGIRHRWNWTLSGANWCRTLRTALIEFSNTYEILDQFNYWFFVNLKEFNLILIKEKDALRSIQYQHEKFSGWLNFISHEFMTYVDSMRREKRDGPSLAKWEMNHNNHLSLL